MRRETSGIRISIPSLSESSIPKPARWWSIPFRKTGFGQIAQGGLQIDIDKQGRIYFGNMSQMQIVRFDPKTGKMETFKLRYRSRLSGTAI